MKTRISAVFLAAIVALGAFSVSASAERNFSYDVAKRQLTVRQRIDEPSSAFADILVLPYGFDRGTLNAEVIDSETMLLKVEYTLGGMVSDEILLNEQFRSGEYIAYIECGDSTNRNVFIVPSDLIDMTVLAVNSGQLLANVSFGADEQIFESNKAIIQKLVVNGKPAEGYTPQTFVETYLQAEGLARCKNVSLSIDEFAELYQSYFGDIFLTYRDWNNEKQKKYADTLTAYNIASAAPGVIASEVEFVADCKTAQNSYQLSDFVIDHIKTNNLSFGKYYSLNNYHQNLSFSELYNKIQSLNSASAICNEFISICDKLYDTSTKNNGNNSGSGGGTGSGSGGSVSLPSNETIAGMVGANEANTSDDNAASQIFTDVSGHWGEVYISECYKNGMLNGYEDRTFRPENLITRAETAAIICKLLGLKGESSGGFADVADDEWYSGYISEVYHAGIVSGYDGNFFPEENITRQDMAVILMRVLDNRGVAINGSYFFGDSAEISDYARDSVLRLAANEIITGSDNLFRPTDCLTRAEAAALMCRVKNIIS